MTPTVQQPKAPDPLPPIQQPQGQKPKAKSSTPTFLGAAAVPSMGNSSSSKTLLGQ